MKRIIILCFLLYIFVINIYAQNKKKLDSLINIYNTAKHDTTKILALKDIAFGYRNSKPDTCIALAEKVLQMSEKIGFEKGKAWAWNNMGFGYFVKSDYLQPLIFFQKSIILFEKTQEKRGVASSLNNIGLVYYKQGNYPLALEYHQKSQKIKEEIGDKSGISASLNNIGLIYYAQNNYPLTLDYYKKSLKIDEELDDKSGVASSLNNIGSIYYTQKNYPLALEYFQKSLKIKEEIGNKSGIAASLNNIGDIYLDQGNYPLALEYHQKSQKIKEEIGDKQGITYTLNSISKIYQKQKDYDKSIVYAQQSLQIAREIKALGRISSASEVLFNGYKLKGNYAKALEYHELYKTSQDSIFNVEKSKSIANLESKAEVERKQKEIELLNKNKALLEKDNQLQKIESERQKNDQLILEKQLETNRLKAFAQNEKDKRKQDSLQNLAIKSQLETDRLKAIEEQLSAESKARKLEVIKEKEEKEFQQLINFLVVVVLLSVILFAYFIYRSRQKEKKAKEEISEQNNEIQQQAEELMQVNEEMKQQAEELFTTNENLGKINHILEDTTSRLESSIRSAKTIQTAILPHKVKLDSLLEEYFILYRPKDVVSGDFYWLNKVEDKTILILADCTGHGVPGAFMTLIGCNLLDKIIRMWHITEPSQILQRLHQEIEIILQQKETENNNGMDMTVLQWYKEGNITYLSFAGAKQSIFYYMPESKEIVEVKGSRKSIGGEQNIKKEFETHILMLPENSVIYISSDGLEDQNSQCRKKFGKDRIKTVLAEMAYLPLAKQQEILEQTLYTYMDGTEQRDDILFIGVKV